MKKYLQIALAVLLVAAVVWALVLNSNNGTLTSDKNALTEQVSRLTSEVEELTGSLSDEKTTSATLTEQVTKLTEDAEQAAKEAEDALNQVKADLESATTKASEDAEAAEKTISELTEAKASLEANVEALTEGKETLEKTVSEQEATISTQAKTIANRESFSRKTYEELQSVKASLKAAEAEAVETQAEIDSLTESLTAAKETAAAEAADLQAKLDAANQEKETLTATIANLNQTVEDMIAKANEPATDAQDIVILYTSDVHCGVDQNYGYVGLAAKRNELVSEGYAVVLVDDGDAIQGEPVGTMTKGSAIIDIMNVVGYDVATPGNHEFDYGMQNFLDLASDRAEFPYVSCNFTYKGELVFPAYVIKEVAGKKIAFIGISTPRTIVTSTPTYFQDEDGIYVYGFCEGNDGQNFYDAVQKAIDDARQEGADYVIAMAHLGIEGESSPYMSTEVIEHTRGLDILLDGHAHETMACNEVKDLDGHVVLRTACGTKLQNIGYAKITADGQLSTGLYNYATVGTDAATEQAVMDATEELNKELETVVAHTDVDLVIYAPDSATEDHPDGIRIIRMTETNLGDLCADAYLDQAKADIALVNGGGIRVQIPAGDITKNDILRVHPFGNSLTVVEATGQQILDALEWTSRNVPDENGGFLHVAGLTYEIHTYLPNACEQDDQGNFVAVTGERRVQNVLVAGEPLDLDKTYVVASHNYMLLDGGDGTNMFMKCNVLQDSVKLDNQVLIDYIVDTLGGNVGEAYADPYGQGRIIAVAEAPAEETVDTAEDEASEAEVVEEAPATEETEEAEDTEEAVDNAA